MSKKLQQMAQKGSMMVEALAMLGLIAMVTPVLYKKAAERTTELQDINSAAQMRTISKALDDYIKDNYVEFTTQKTTKTWEVDAADIEPYLPYGFNMDESKLFDGYQMSIRREVTGEINKEHAALTGLVVAPVKDKLPGIRSAKIASMIGANGSVYKDCSGPAGDGVQFCGVQGGWFASKNDYKFNNANFDEGSIASISIHAINSASGASPEHVLFRDTTMGDDSYNTMETNLIMGGWSIDQVHRLIADSESASTIRITGSEEDNTAAESEASLYVNGAAAVKNLLEAGSANLAEIFQVEQGAGITAKEKLTVTAGGLDVTGETQLNDKLTVGTSSKEAAADIYGTLTAKKNAIIEQGLTAKGMVSQENVDGVNNKYSLVVEGTPTTGGSLLVKQNAKIANNLWVGGTFSADKIYGRTKLGGGWDGSNYNFEADKDAVTVRNTFEVAGRMYADDSESKLMYNDYQVRVANGEAQMKGTGNNFVKVAGNNVTASAVGTFTAQGANSGNNQLVLDGNATLKGANAYLNADASSGTAQVSGKTAKLVSGTNMAMADSGGVLMQVGNTGSNATHAKVSLNNSYNVGIHSKNLYVDDEKLSVGDNAYNLSVSDTTPAGTLNQKGVLIRRNGIINLPRSTAYSGDSNVTGYVKLDRIVSNEGWSDPINQGSRFGTVSKPYDSFQVNPAYTSVMHDIKLTTRGGARLSDILPDFINKGIYVIDNTYEEKEGKTNWENYTVNSSGRVENGPSECTKQECIASPWLGFVPTPQCPPGYSKVITINPIRWKMAEAYTVAMNPTGASSAYEKFKAFFIAPRDPTKARFELSSVSASGSHTHDVPSGYGLPLTFQTNTWLNTTIAAVRAGSTSGTDGNKGTIRANDFMGWHAIMGFLYYGSDYQDYVTHTLNRGDLVGSVIWNLFPVYKEELTAIANVYCYFERRSLAVGGSPFSWNSSLVDTEYDQLTGFRSYGTKEEPYKSRLNDPALGYDDPW